MSNKWLAYLTIRRSGLFDARFYLRANRDVRSADTDPLLHFIEHGWKEGRNPSSLFNTQEYLERNPDVRAAGVNPLLHYVRYGRAEGRPIGASHRSPSFSLPNRGNYSPTVSVIVPNYNHGAYLRERLDSIYGQTYQHIEVILLDDSSTDDSISILDQYADQHPDITRCYFNKENSGSPFSQWERGLLLATGELAWIAESDDSCERDFLEKLVPFLSDESVLLAFAHPVFVDRRGKAHPFAFETYVGQIDPYKWAHSYIETSHNEVNAALGLLNTIPNVSGVLFRKVDQSFPLFKDPDWKRMRVCGDWLFYLHLLRGGRIAYCADTHNYYRIHEESTSKKTHALPIYYREHQQVACAIARLYKVPEDLLTKLHGRLRAFYSQNAVDGSESDFDRAFDLELAIQCMKERRPNVLMAAYAFAFGGGEIFPVRLANALRDGGASVTFFNGGYELTVPGVRRMLSPQVPVIENSPLLDVPSMLADFGIEIIHTHHASMENYFAVTRMPGLSSVRHVATMHGMYEMMSAAQFLYRIGAIHGSVDHWVYAAEKNVAPFKKYGMFKAARFTKIDNAMQPPTPEKADLSALGITPESFTACLASRALPTKGWLEAITATARVRERTMLDVHLLLIGEGPVFDTLNVQDLPPFIHLLGSRANLADFLASAQLGLLPSYFEGESFPLVLIEYFMAGLPVVASDIGEIPRMMTVDENRPGGLLVGLHGGKVDAEELATAMTRLLTDKELYAECVESAAILRTRFSIDRATESYLGVYERTLHETTKCSSGGPQGSTSQEAAQAPR